MAANISLAESFLPPHTACRCALQVAGRQKDGGGKEKRKFHSDDDQTATDFKAAISPPASQGCHQRTLTALPTPHPHPPASPIRKTLSRDHGKFSREFLCRRVFKNWRHGARGTERVFFCRKKLLKRVAAEVFWRLLLRVYVSNLTTLGLRSSVERIPPG